MAGVVEHARRAAAADLGHHVRHHRAQTGPGHHAAGVDAGEALVDPLHQRADAIGADVTVVAVELCGAGDAETVVAQAAADQLGFVVQQADGRSRGAADLVGQVDGDRVALDRVDVHPVAELGCQCTAGGAGANHQAVELQPLVTANASEDHAGTFAVAGHRLHVGTVAAAHAKPLDGGGQAVGELVDITGGVAFGVVAAVVAASQGWLDGAHLLGRHAAPRQAAFGEQARNLSGMIEAGLVAVDVQDALLLQVEVDAFGFGPGEQMLARGNGQPSGLDGVLAVVGDRADELGEPGELVPAGLGVDQQRRVALEHPLEALDDRRPVVPDLGIGRRQLAAIGERGLHGRVAVLFQQGDREAALGQGIGGGDAGDAATDDCDCFHCCAPERRGVIARAPNARRAPPLFWT